MSHGIKHTRSQDLIDYAYDFAKAAHAGQVRKYTGEPYINHPVAVATLVASVTDDCNMICAALLHDTVEDCAVTIEEIATCGFGHPIAYLVDCLTDVSKLSDGNRATRKGIDRMHTANGSKDAKTIKLADLIDNSRSIVAHDPGFSVVYMTEKRLLLPFLIEGDAALYADAVRIMNEYYEGIL